MRICSHSPSPSSEGQRPALLVSSLPNSHTPHALSTAHVDTKMPTPEKTCQVGLSTHNKHLQREWCNLAHTAHKKIPTIHMHLGSSAECTGIFIRWYRINVYGTWPESWLHKWSCLEIQTCGKVQEATAHKRLCWETSYTLPRSGPAMNCLQLPLPAGKVCCEKIYLQEQKTYPGFTIKNWRQVTKLRGVKQHMLSSSEM